MKSHFNDLNDVHADDAPITLPDLAGRTIGTANLIHGTESGELVLLTGEDWHATIHHNHNTNGQPYLSAAFYQTARKSTSEQYAAVTAVPELEGVTILHAESSPVHGSATVCLHGKGGVRIRFVAGSEPGTIDIATERDGSDPSRS